MQGIRRDDLHGRLAPGMDEAPASSFISGNVELQLLVLNIILYYRRILIFSSRYFPSLQTNWINIVLPTSKKSSCLLNTIHSRLKKQ